MGLLFAGVMGLLYLAVRFIRTGARGIVVLLSLPGICFVLAGALLPTRLLAGLIGGFHLNQRA